MEKGKRKYLLEPVQQQGSSKYGKVSKFVLRILKNEPIIPPTDSLKPRISPPKSFISEKEKSLQVNIADESPSIVLCRTGSGMNDSVVEQHLDISPHAIVKKIKLIPTCQMVELKSKSYLRQNRKSRAKLLTSKKFVFTSPYELPQTPTSIEAMNTSQTPATYDSPRLTQIPLPSNELEKKLVADRVIQEEMRLRRENERLSQLLADLKIKVQKASEIESYQRERLTLTKLKLNLEMLYYYVGFKDIELLNLMVEKLTDYFSQKEKVCKDLLIEDQLMMTLMKLRRNYSMHDLAFRFRVELPEADCIVFHIISALHHIYYNNDLKEKPFPPVSTICAHLPEQFTLFPNCRVVLECVRIGCEDPDCSSETDILTSTKFDPKIYVKGFLGISPTKNVIFASGVYEDATNNTDIFKESGILHKLKCGDLIMADKSFDIRDCIPPMIELNVACSTKLNLTDKQIKNFNSKARAYIGRTTMQHIRRFTILNHVPIFLNSIVLQVFQLCSALVNLQPTINSYHEPQD